MYNNYLHNLLISFVLSSVPGCFNKLPGTAAEGRK